MMSPPEAGQVALSYAETIFSTGDELMSVLQNQQHPERQSLRVGAVATLFRNFQENLLQPLLPRDDVQLSLQSGRLRELLQGLRVHSLDLVLSNQRVQATAEDPWRCRRIARQPVSLAGKPRRSGRSSAFRRTWQTGRWSCRAKPATSDPASTCSAAAWGCATGCRPRSTT